MRGVETKPAPVEAAEQQREHDRLHDGQLHDDARPVVGRAKHAVQRLRLQQRELRARACARVGCGPGARPRMRLPLTEQEEDWARARAFDYPSQKRKRTGCARACDHPSQNRKRRARGWPGPGRTWTSCAIVTAFLTRWLTRTPALLAK